MLTLCLCAFFLYHLAPAQTPVLVEDFNYPQGALLTDNGWAAHSAGGTNAITAVSPGLTLTGYPGSGVGNTANMTTSGEDDNRTFAIQSSGSVYAAFMVRVSEAAVDPIGGYFFHLGPDPIGTTFRGRVFIKKDASNNIAFGISKAATADPNVAFTGFTFSLNTTYLVIVKYTIVDGASNDTVDLFVSPTVPATEPAPTVSALDNLTQSDISPGSVALRQGTASTHPTVQVDGIRVGTSWASVTTGSVAPQQNVVDYNGDGKTDFALVRNAGGQKTWYINLNGTNTTYGVEWGLSSDIFVSGDFDGDNKSDIAVWRGISTNQPSGNAFFYILQSQTNTVLIEDFGQSGDYPLVVGDYDGDGKDDVAVYRQVLSPGAQSTWFYKASSGTPSGIVSVPWGIFQDTPAPGDYDGDGKNDFVVRRGNPSSPSSSATFWMNQTSDGITTRVFGNGLDIIVPGDYDGDSKTDLAIVRSLGGVFQWWHQKSSDGMVTQTTFGSATTDSIAQGDYDGDGKTDQAVWRASPTVGSSVFWFNGSTSGVGAISFGHNGDAPVAGYNSH